MYLWASSKTTSLLNRRPCHVVSANICEKHYEESERFVLLDELVPKVDDHEAPRTQDVGQARGVIDILLSELQPQKGEVLEVVG